MLKIQQSMTAPVNQNHFFLAFQFGFLGFFNHTGQGMRGFRCGNNPFSPGKGNACIIGLYLLDRSRVMIPSSANWLTVGAIP